jgi:hypothetical protein
MEIFYGSIWIAQLLINSYIDARWAKIDIRWVALAILLIVTAMILSLACFGSAHFGLEPNLA